MCNSPPAEAVKATVNITLDTHLIAMHQHPAACRTARSTTAEQAAKDLRSPQAPPS